MSSLNLSTNGPSITKSYNSVVESPAPTGPAAASPTYGQWAIFSVSAPLANAFQQDTGKESVLKVQSTGEGELLDLIDEFSDGRFQFAFVKVKDPNTGLPKNVLIAWCGEGVPERTKGYFTSYLTAVAKLLHGYHVQVTARSETDLVPEGIVQKVADASGSKYSAGSASSPIAAHVKPPVASKPVFTPTQTMRSSASISSSSRMRDTRKDETVDEDGWGADAPPVTRTQLEKVQPAYQPTRVDLGGLQKTSPEPTSSNVRTNDGSGPDVVKGAYQPVGKVDIAAIRRQAQESGTLKDDRPTTVKGSYEPVGKVDIAAIRAKAQKPADTGIQGGPASPSGPSESPEAPRPLADRSAAFMQSERITSLPKPKVGNKFGGGNSFAGTTAPVPSGYGNKPPPAAAPVGSASRTFADQGGKTPAQLWAEKKARQQGTAVTSPGLPTATSPIQSQTSGGGQWESGYTGKKWAPVHTTHTGKSASSIDQQKTGSEQADEEPAPQSPGIGVGSLRDRFSGAAPMGAPAPGAPFEGAAPEPVESTKPNRGTGIAIPGLAKSPAFEMDAPSLPTPPPQPRSPSPPTPAEMRSTSPVRIAMPVSHEPAGAELSDVHGEQMSPPPPMPVRAMEQAAAAEQSEDDEPAPDIGRAAAYTAATSAMGEHAIESAAPMSESRGKTALVQYDYEADESNEISLKEGEHVTDIEMVDADWWMGTNTQGQSGLFPSNYVELVETDEAARSNPDASAPSPPSPPAAAPTGPASSGQGQTATSLYDYEAAESNELSFPEGATLTNVEFPDDDWWLGEYNGQSGLFPANYVQLDN